MPDYLRACLTAALCLYATQTLAAPLNERQLALHVLNRTAYGPTPGEVDAVATMGVDQYLAQQLHPEQIAMPADLAQRLASLQALEPSGGEILNDIRGNRGKGMPAVDPEVKKAQRKALYRRATLVAEEEHLTQAIYSPRQLQEVMVDFWYNHFNVYIGKELDRILVSSYERDAIRPHVLGRFRDLLGATARHPAMLFYLDNWLSAAPGYKGRNKQITGLNENYAREVMELHTLGVDGGYSQQDVTELARMLTGWTFDRRGALFNGDIRFGYDSDRHDNGSKTWLGAQIAPAGEDEGEHALDVLAASPITARHISYQLAQYFVADEPPPALVKQLTSSYLKHDGDIASVLTTLFASKEFRDPSNRSAKFKTPWQYVVSSVRASGVAATNMRPFVGELNRAGMPIYGCQTPDGYKNTEQAWLSADAVSNRISFATALASGKLPLLRVMAAGDDASAPASKEERANWNPAPVATAPLLNTLSDALSPHTLDTVQHANPALQSALILGSPDFMRR